MPSGPGIFHPCTRYRDGSREGWHKVKDTSWHERASRRFDRVIVALIRPRPGYAGSVHSLQSDAPDAPDVPCEQWP